MNKIVYIPYEKLSQAYWLKLQQQIIPPQKYILWKSIIHKIRGWWFRVHYYRDADGTIKNSLTDTPYIIHEQHGRCVILGKPCTPDCKKRVTIYPEYVLK